ncbi:MAG TPA: M28 family peptidase [Candidatus Thermoplasmatota archaeon]|nr:M28 family peptidase [Candidatus Thermoplasmatota archaeon]
MRALFALLAVVLVAGCTLPGPAPTPTSASPPTPAVTPTPGPTYAPRFDGAKAHGWVERQVRDDAGQVRYRIPGTEGNAEVARLVDAELSGLGFAVHWHFFNATFGCEQVPMHNVVAERAGTSGRVLVLAAHYDTRPIADKDPDPALRAHPVIGANDGASGVAVLLELARVLPPTNDTVRLVFFDGEDGGGYKNAGRTVCTDWILGSRAYAASLTQAEVDAMDALVLVDMIGDADLSIPREGYTVADADARAVQDQVYAAAKRLGHAQFLDRTSYQIEDDHVPFLERGVPAVDLIHLLPAPGVFPAWHHTVADDLDQVSAGSLDAVGETLEAWLAAR